MSQQNSKTGKLYIVRQKVSYFESKKNKYWTEMLYI